MADMAGRDPVEVYCGLMAQVKRRIAVIQRFTTAAVTLGEPDLDYECISVQFRKILELIAFASLCANKDQYGEARRNFATHWNARRLLNNLEQIHRDFYPVAVSETGQASMVPGPTFEAIPDGFLTKDEFVELYETCSEVIHQWNPFRRTEYRIDFRLAPAEWSRRIVNLLDLHFMRLAGSDKVWLIVMQHVSDGKVRAVVANPVPLINPDTQVQGSDDRTLPGTGGRRL